MKFIKNLFKSREQKEYDKLMKDKENAIIDYVNINLGNWNNYSKAEKLNIAEKFLKGQQIRISYWGETDWFLLNKAIDIKNTNGKEEIIFYNHVGDIYYPKIEFEDYLNKLREEREESEE